MMKPKKQKASCFCATYGRPRILEEAIQSFLRQDYDGEKELIILNDHPDQHLVFDHPEVKIINVKDRITPLGKKFNDVAALCSGEVLFVWEDDDIYLSNRISYSMAHLNQGLFHTGQGFFEKSQHDIVASKNYFHCNLAVNKTLFWSVGGYPETDRSRNDVDIFKLLDVFRLQQLVQWSEVFYLYRWSSTGSYHGSAWGGDTDGISDLAEEFVNMRPTETGTIQLDPHWRYDYETACDKVVDFV